jgi:hypothetical protein
MTRPSNDSGTAGQEEVQEEANGRNQSGIGNRLQEFLRGFNRRTEAVLDRLRPQNREDRARRDEAERAATEEEYLRNAQAAEEERRREEAERRREEEQEAERRREEEQERRIAANPAPSYAEALDAEAPSLEQLQQLQQQPPQELPPDYVMPRRPGLPRLPGFDPTALQRSAPGPEAQPSDAAGLSEREDRIARILRERTEHRRQSSPGPRRNRWDRSQDQGNHQGNGGL